jgi:hypothetical protein
MAPNSRFAFPRLSVNDIIRQLQAELGDDVVYGITSHGFLELRAKQLRGEQLA